MQDSQDMPRNATEEARDDGQMTGGIIEIDVHGKNIEEAKKAIDIQIHTAGKSINRLRVIHGYNDGTRIRSMLREEYGYGREPAVKRIEMGSNQGITELVLREF